MSNPFSSQRSNFDEDDDDGDGDDDDSIIDNDDNDDGDGDGDDGDSDNDFDDDDGGSTVIVVRRGRNPPPPPSQTQGVCFEDQCIQVSGVDEDECNIAMNCGVGTHLECKRGACTEVPGSGGNECSDDIGCNEHSICQGLACVVVAGKGESECFSVRDCFFRKDPPSQVLAEEEIIRVLDDKTPVAICGNGITEPPEECDDRNSINGDGCSGLCRQELLDSTYCGNGFLERGEECEDGNIFSGDGCFKCVLEERSQTLVASASICGDGILAGREECDDRNRRDNDGCSSTCLLEIGICGDGRIQTMLGEQCEPSTHSPSLEYQCRNCRFFSTRCGDGNLDAGEECDKGALNSSSPDAACRPDCSLSRCGDGVLDSAEQCDDSGRINGDGCDRFCRIETDESSSSSSLQTQVAGQNFQYQTQQQQLLAQYYAQFGSNIQFPGQANFQQLPYQLPLAQLQPLVQSQAPIGDTGPAAVAVIGAGAAAGFSWIRRKRK